MSAESRDNQSEIFRSHCVRVYEAWEESGYLYIQSELCEKGNLNDYLIEINHNKRAEFENYKMTDSN